MYSLINAPTVGFDLARQHTGAAVATVLLEALATEGADLGAFDPAVIADARRAAAWLEVSALAPTIKLDQALSAARQAVDEAVQSFRAQARNFEPMVGNLSAAYFGGFDDLLQLLRNDILADVPDHVATMGSDALAAAFGGRRLPDDVRHLLGAPWIAASRTLPPIPADLGPFTPQLRRVLERAAVMNAAEALVLCEATKALEADWSRRMHDAAWATYLSGRLRPAAAAQFQAVRSLRVCGVDAAMAARGVWNAVSGCLQAIAVHDLLDEVTYGVLVGPWETAMGILE